MIGQYKKSTLYYVRGRLLDRHEFVLSCLIFSSRLGDCDLFRKRDLPRPKEVPWLHADLFCKMNG
jgi:hypothetical protein